MTKTSAPAKAHRPQAYTVFGAAIVAGAAAAFGLNSALDSHLAQAKPQVESESILVALRPLPAGAPVTVWDVGLRDWPKAMVPSTAMRVTDDLDNLVVRHPLREGQPILAVQLGRVDTAGEPIARPIAVAASPPPAVREPERDLWDAAPTTTAPPTTSVTTNQTNPTNQTPTVTTISTTFATAATTLPTPAAPRDTAATTATMPPAAEPPPTAGPRIVAADLPDGAPSETASPTAMTNALAPTTSPSSTVEPRSEPDPVVFPITETPGPTVASVTPTVDAPAPIEIRSPRVASGDAPPSPMRTALRPRPSVVQALAVPDRSALSEGGNSTAGEASALPRLSGRVASAASAAGEGVAAPETTSPPPRMIPTDRGTRTPSPSTAAQAPPAPQPRSRATPPTARSTRSQGFTKGYRPN